VAETAIRRYEAGDATAVAELLNAIAAHAGYHPWAVPAAVESFVAAGRMLAEVLHAAAAAGMARARARLMVDADSPTGAVGVDQRAGFAVESRAVTYTAPLAAGR
jgi:C4-dicarboxylate transporter